MSLYTLMIVDDEKRIREGLATGFDWDTLGFTVSGTAANGAEALALALANPPDVIITDIRMPVMDGLEFMSQLHECHPEILLVVLSGFDEFEYAQKAISLGVVGYLLKPVSESELTLLIGKLQKRLAGRQGAKAGAAENPLLPRLSREELADNQLRSLLYGDVSDPGEAQRQLKELAPRLPEKNLAVLVLSYPPELNVRQACRELTRRLGGRFLPDGNRITGLISYRLQKEDHMGSEAKALFSTLDALLPGSAAKIIVSCSRPFAAAERAPIAYREALELQRYSFYAVPEEFLRYSGPARALPEKPSGEMAEKLREAIESGSEVELRVLLKSFFEEQKQQLYPKEMLALHCLQLCEAVAVQQSALSGEERSSLLARLMACPTFLELRSLAESIFLTLLGRSRSSRAGSEQTLIQRIEGYIQDNYEKKLTLSSLASMFHINASYLSYLFCQKTGIPLSAYIQDVRISNAKRLLASADYRISEIASLVGYREYRHFCTVFKKEVGQTPMNYRLSRVIRPDQP